MTSLGIRRLGGLMATVALAMCLSGCSDSQYVCDGCLPDYYLPQTTPDNVLSNFQMAWRTRDIDRYSQLLAEDYRFYFDNKTRVDKGLPPFWTAAQESTQVGKLFNSPRVADIAIALKWPHGTAHPATEPGRENWVYLDVFDVYLDVDMAPTNSNPEGITYRVEDQKQRYYFRRGKTEPAAPGDTLFYLAEWRDFGTVGLSASGGSQTTIAEPPTWSRVKTLIND